MKLPNCRVPAFLLLPVALAACGGGGSAANDVADSMSNALECTVRNCTEPSTLRADEISMRFTATQKAGDSNLTVSGFVSKSANVTTTVLLQPNESLSASVDGGRETPLRNPDGQRLDYEVSLPASSPQPEVWLIFKRDGVQHISGVVMPPAFSVVEPTGTPLLTRSAGNLTVKLAPAPTAQNSISASMQGSCTRKDGSTFEVKPHSSLTMQASPTAGYFRIDTVPLDKALNDAGLAANKFAIGTSLVSRCNLTLTWSAEVSGTSPKTLNHYSTFTASRQASNSIVYDSWL